MTYTWAYSDVMYNIYKIPYSLGHGIENFKTRIYWNHYCIILFCYNHESQELEKSVIYARTLPDSCADIYCLQEVCACDFIGLALQVFGDV